MKIPPYRKLEVNLKFTIETNGDWLLCHGIRDSIMELLARQEFTEGREYPNEWIFGGMGQNYNLDVHVEHSFKNWYYGLPAWMMKNVIVRKLFWAWFLFMSSKSRKEC